MLAILSVDIGNAECSAAGPVHCEIQQAEDVAVPGDVIEIATGTYLPVVIDIDSITLRAERSDSVPVIDAVDGNHALVIDANEVTIEGLRLENAPSIAVFVRGDNNVVRQNIATENRNGFVIFGGEGNLLSDNFSSGDNEGIGLFNSDGNVVRNNVSIGNREGLAIRGNLGSSNNTFARNQVEGSTYGIRHRAPSTGNTFLHNIVRENELADFRLEMEGEDGRISVAHATTYGPTNVTLEAPGFPAADPLTYTASLQTAEFYLDQTLDLNFTGDYSQNHFGFDEKWLLGGDELTWYYLTPEGGFFRWNGGGPLNRTWLAQLDPATYANPALLYDAQSGTAGPGSVSVTDDTLTITHENGFVGSFSAEVTVSNGTTSETTLVLVNVTPNEAPGLMLLENQTLPTTQDVLEVTLAAIDPTLDKVTFSASVQSGESYLDQTLELQLFQGELFTNWSGSQAEKWVLGGNGTDWYFITPNGDFWHWLGGSRDIIANSEFIARLSPATYADPALLYDAQPGAAVPATVAVADNTLTLDPEEGFVGTISVLVTATDVGGLTDSKLVRVDVTAGPAVAAARIDPIDGEHVTEQQSALAIKDGSGRSHWGSTFADDSSHSRVNELTILGWNIDPTVESRHRFEAVREDRPLSDSMTLDEDVIAALALELLLSEK